MLLSVHTLLLFYSTLVHSPVNGEPPAIASGVYTWTQSRFWLQRVNPPLSRAISSLPVVCMAPRTSWDGVVDQLGERPEYLAGREFILLNANDFQWFLVLARWFCIPISLLGGWLCWRWATDLYSSSAGLLALGLWCFCPNILAHGQLATSDMCGTVFGLLSCYLFWKWLKLNNWKSVGGAGIALGFALLSKATDLYLVPYLAIVGCMAVLYKRYTSPIARESSLGVQYVSIFLIGWLVIHAGYGFQNALVPLKCFRFTSGLLGGKDTSPQQRLLHGRNRFTGSYLGELPSPLPADYLIGIDLQQLDFEASSPSYLRGEWRTHGWWWYYIYAAAIKLPVGTLSLVALAVISCIPGERRIALRECDIFLICPAIIIFILVSSQLGMNRHFRYALPALPFIFIFTSRVASVSLFTQWPRRVGLAWTLLLCGAMESLWLYPHSLSFFNMFVSPWRGGQHLTDSNIDWGQDFLYLKHWLVAHPSCRPVYMSDSGFYPLDFLDIGTVHMPDKMSRFASTIVTGKPSKVESPEKTLLPGYYALGVGQLFECAGRYSHFLNFEPVATAGYSIYIYDISLEDARIFGRKPGGRVYFSAIPKD